MRRTRLMTVLAGAAALAAGSLAPADVVTTTDGRRLEGEIVETDAASVTIDAKMSPTVRATVRIDRAQIESIERAPVPEGFFDPPPVAPRAASPAQDGAAHTLYLEVPIIGAFGTDVLAEGVDQAIRYAKRYLIPHIVFVIDSEGGELDDVQAVYDLLRRNRRQVAFHALVRRCLGGALAVPLWCDTIHLAPGAVLGGDEPARRAASEQPVEDRVVRAQIANDVVRQVGLGGAVAEIVGAMIDPARTLIAWRDDAGAIVVDDAVPADVSADRILFDVGPGELLVLDERQAVELGLETYDGVAAGLGEVLEVDGWRLESDFGRQAMADAAARRRAEAREASAAFSDEVEDNVRRRQMANEYLAEALQRASEWDPSEGSYDYYVRRWGWGWRSGKVRMTHDSRQRWAQRSDLAMQALLQAAEAVKALEKLDRRAIELGLEPTFRPDQLLWVKQDIQTKYNYLAANRNRRN